MQKINIVGAGPAGTFFAILMRQIFPGIEIRVFERNRADDVEGWGIVLNSGTAELLLKYDAPTHDRLIEHFQHWSDVDTIHKGETISVRGKPYVSVSRKLVTNTLRRRCEELEIPIAYETDIEDVAQLEDCDLLVGADGVSSVVRARYGEHFQPEIDIRPDYFIWLGTRRIFPTITHLFKANEHGLLSAEGYVYSPEASTFIVICSPRAWQDCGFGSMSQGETLAYLEDCFDEELEGHGLLANEASIWRNFPLIKNAHWYHPRVLLLGDALHTAHFSIGSGTRLAIEDSIMAAEHFRDCGDGESALRAFAEKRRPFIERYQRAAFDSLQWYENVESIIDMSPVPFTFEAMTRSDQLGVRSLKLQDPEFVERYRQWKSAHAPG